MSDKVVIYKSSLSGKISIPASKSQTMRALIFSLLAQGKSCIFNPLLSPDTQAMIEACRFLGAKIKFLSNSIEVQGGLKAAENVIDAGNSGQILRFIGAVAGLLPTYTVLTGDDSIRHRRPVQPLLEGLTQLGAWAVSTRNDSFAPIIVKGPIEGGIATISGEDSQPVSGLLIAAAFAQSKSELSIKNPGEIPWIGLTLSWLDRLNIPYENNDFKQYIIPGGAKISGFDYHVPGDWSSALYPIAAALATDSEVTIEGVDFADPQGDKEVIALLKKMGADISINPSEHSVTVHRCSKLKGLKIDISPFIDAITLLPVIACRAKGTTEIVGGGIARSKESDRIHAIVSELKKMGAQIDETVDGMIIEPSNLKGAQVCGHQDHRIVLALSVAALCAEGATEIVGIAPVSKSFPMYFKALHQLGAKIE